MRNILYSRRYYEKINPGAFDKSITVLVHTLQDNEVGEKVEAYLTGSTYRGLLGSLNSAIEDMSMNENNTFYNAKAVVITWKADDLLNTKNRLLIDGVEFNILDSAESFARNRFVRLLVEAVR